MRTKQPKTGTLEKLRIADLVQSEYIQPRVRITQEIVYEYMDALQRGDKLPPVLVMCDPKTKELFLVDGFHRVQAYERLGRKYILAEVRSGTARDAIVVASGLNTTHGLRRSNEDKRLVVTRFLRDVDWSKGSDRSIAGVCKVSNTFVSDLRTHLSTLTDTPRTKVLVQRQGATYEQTLPVRIPVKTEERADPEKVALQVEVLEPPSRYVGQVPGGPEMPVPEGAGVMTVLADGQSFASMDEREVCDLLKAGWHRLSNPGARDRMLRWFQRNRVPRDSKLAPDAGEVGRNGHYSRRG
jgi:hypothetical protein